MPKTWIWNTQGVRPFARSGVRPVLAAMVAVTLSACGTLGGGGSSSTGTGSSSAVAPTTAVAGGGGSMMGRRSSGGGMSGGGGRQVVTASAMQALAQRVAKTVPLQGNTLHYATTHVTVVALAAPPGRPGMYWQVDGRVNPTIVVPAHSTVTVDFADGDPGHHHGFELTTANPPYPKMAMAAGQVAAPGALIMPVPPPQGSSWYGKTVTFTAPAPGTYHYICPVPGHAQRGMWGTFTVA